MKRGKKYITVIFVGLTLFSISGISMSDKFKSSKPVLDDRAIHDCADRLKVHVKKLSFEIGDRSLFRYERLLSAAAYIGQEFAEYGLRVTKQQYSAGNRIVENIIAQRIGRSKPGETVVVGAHYDTCNNPGADDNASAVAGLLEMARRLAIDNPERTVQFIAFVNEEPPFFKTNLMGSYVYARSAREEGRNIRAAIILEMIGYYTSEPGSQRYPPLLKFFYPDVGNFIAVVGNVRNRWLVGLIESIFKKHSSFPIESLAAVSLVPGIDFSDNWSFWKMDYPAVMITDTSFYRNTNYHKKTDTYETLDYLSMAEVVRGLYRVLLELAGDTNYPVK
jgi:hypothetical protein